MKQLFYTLVVVGDAAMPAFAAAEHQPQHGGIVVETKAGDRLEARDNFKVDAGSKVLADVALNGKPADAARFALKYAESART